MGGKLTLTGLLNHSARLSRGSDGAIECVGLLKQYTSVNALTVKGDALSRCRVNDGNVGMSISSAARNFPPVNVARQAHIKHHQQAVRCIGKQFQSFFPAGGHLNVEPGLDERIRRTHKNEGIVFDQYELHDSTPSQDHGSSHDYC
jgi:hypothetical protein